MRMRSRMQAYVRVCEPVRACMCACTCEHTRVYVLARARAYAPWGEIRRTSRCDTPYHWSRYAVSLLGPPRGGIRNEGENEQWKAMLRRGNADGAMIISNEQIAMCNGRRETRLTQNRTEAKEEGTRMTRIMSNEQIAMSNCGRGDAPDCPPKSTSWSIPGLGVRLSMPARHPPFVRRKRARLPSRGTPRPTPPGAPLGFFERGWLTPYAELAKCDVATTPTQACATPQSPFAKHRT